MRVKQSLICGMAAFALLAACGDKPLGSNKVEFDGEYFRAKARVVDKKVSPTDFTVVVRGVSATLDGAREAGRYEGIKFCVQNFGSSRIDWKVGPDTEPQELDISDDILTFSGTCQRP